MKKKLTHPDCAVSGCKRKAVVEVFLYDLYLLHCGFDMVFWEQDHTCPYLCDMHLRKNEQQAVGQRKPRGEIRYPYTNKDEAQGFSVYRPLSFTPKVLETVMSEEEE